MISCIILAGGKSKRMEKSKSEAGTKTGKKVKGRKKSTKKRKKKSKKGKLKAFMKLDGKPLIAYVLTTVKKFSHEIVIVVKTKKQKAELDKLISSPKISVVADKLKTYSPIAGIKAGLKHVSGDDVLIVACDMPFINGVTIFRMMNKMRKGVDCVVPSKSGKHEPLCALYKKRVFKNCKLDESLQDIIDKSKKILIPIYRKSVFFNINSPEDLKEAEKILENKKI